MISALPFGRVGRNENERFESTISTPGPAIVQSASFEIGHSLLFEAWASRDFAAVAQDQSNLTHSNLVDLYRDRAKLQTSPRSTAALACNQQELSDLKFRTRANDLKVATIPHAERAAFPEVRDRRVTSRVG